MHMTTKIHILTHTQCLTHMAYLLFIEYFSSSYESLMSFSYYSLNFTQQISIYSIIIFWLYGGIIRE